MTAFLIVSVSVVSGAAMPLVMVRAGFDPAVAGPAIQVFMDIVGVTITCVVCNFILVVGVVGSGLDD